MESDSYDRSDRAANPTGRSNHLGLIQPDIRSIKVGANGHLCVDLEKEDRGGIY